MSSPERSHGMYKHLFSQEKLLGVICFSQEKHLELNHFPEKLSWE